jgi:hypothetical protein
MDWITKTPMNLKERIKSLVAHPNILLFMDHLVEPVLRDGAKQVAFMYRGKIFRVMETRAEAFFASELMGDSVDQTSRYCDRVRWKYTDYSTELLSKLKGE